ARGAEVILEVQPELKRLLSGLKGTQVVAHGEALPGFDLHCPLLSLPRAFNTRLATIPALTDPLRVTPELTQKWDAKLGPRPKPRVGIAWPGRSNHPNDSNRSIALDKLLPLLDLPVQFVSLQNEVRAEDNAVLAAHAAQILHFGAELVDFLETAALVSLMDV